MYFLHRMNFFVPLENTSCWQAARKKKNSKTKEHQRNWKSTTSQKKETSSSHTLRTRFLEFPPGLAAWHILIEPNVANGPPNTITFVWVAPSIKQQTASFFLHVVTNYCILKPQKTGQRKIQQPSPSNVRRFCYSRAHLLIDRYSQIIAP